MTSRAAHATLRLCRRVPAPALAEQAPTTLVAGPAIYSAHAFAAKRPEVRTFAHASASSSGRQAGRQCAGASPLAGSGLGGFAAAVAAVTAFATFADLPGLQRYLHGGSAPKDPQPSQQSRGQYAASNVNNVADGNRTSPASGDGAGPSVHKRSGTRSASAEEIAVDTTDEDKQSKLRMISRSEVEQHTTEEHGIWVTFGDGVYDVTSFVSKHPGGNKILMAAGSALEPFWAMYAQHKQPEVVKMLDEMRIGTLPEDERLVVTDDPYATDPKRNERIIARSTTPFNGESPLDALLPHITPDGEHYIRNHMPVPDVVQAAYELQVIDSNGDIKSFSLDDLRTKYPKASVITTLQCAGNRRSEMDRVRKVNGLFWRTSISTAEWSGARLSDILRDVGAQSGEDAKHVQFVGLDCDMSGERYGASVPIKKALMPDGDCIIAYEMNGKPIPRDHGFPVRAVIPGHVAARSVKWLEKVIVSDEESDSHWQQHDYKGFCPDFKFSQRDHSKRNADRNRVDRRRPSSDEDWDNLDWSKAPAIQEVPITSAILNPAPEETVPASGGKLAVKGYAVAGGGRAVIRVDVSCDGGETWTVAELQPEGGEQGYKRHWAWRHWHAEVPLPKDKSMDTVKLVCKAVDDSYNVQPDTFKPIYNARGVLSNAWQRLDVPVKQA